MRRWLRRCGTATTAPQWLPRAAKNCRRYRISSGHSRPIRRTATRCVSSVGFTSVAANQLVFVDENVPDRNALLSELVTDVRSLYDESPQLAKELCDGLDLVDVDNNTELAAWTVVVNTLYNLDITKTRE